VTSELGDEHDLSFEAPEFEADVRVRHGVETDALGDTRLDLSTREHADVLTCPCCSGRMKLLALVTDPTSVARYLTSGALASRPTCRSGRTLEDLRIGQVVCSVEVPVVSRRPSSE